MPIDDILDKHKPEFEKVLHHFQHEISALRTGRASPGLLATVIVESYGSNMPLQQVASVTVSDAKTLTVVPWDKSQLPAVEKGILAANLGLTPSNDGISIRLYLPAMTEQRRKELARLLGQMAEHGRIGIRNIREDILKSVKRQEADGKISKDDSTRAQKKVQETVDKYNAQIKDVVSAKEQEIMMV